MELVYPETTIKTIIEGSVKYYNLHDLCVALGHDKETAKHKSTQLLSSEKKSFQTTIHCGQNIIYVTDDAIYDNVKG